MSDYRRILLAVDLTDECRRVARRAMALATAANAELHVLHAIEPLTFAYGGDIAMDLSSVQDQIHEQARAHLADFAALFDIPEQRRHLVFGRAESEIHRVAEAEAMDPDRGGQPRSARYCAAVGIDCQRCTAWRFLRRAGGAGRPRRCRGRFRLGRPHQCPQRCEHGSLRQGVAQAQGSQTMRLPAGRHRPRCRCQDIPRRARIGAVAHKRGARWRQRDVALRPAACVSWRRAGITRRPLRRIPPPRRQTRALRAATLFGLPRRNGAPRQHVGEAGGRTARRTGCDAARRALVSTVAQCAGAAWPLGYVSGAL